MSVKIKDWQVWVRGLFAALIYGASSAGAAWIGMAVAKASGVDVPALNLKALGIIMLTSGLASLFAYLQKSPLPEVVVTEDTVIVSKVIESGKAPVVTTTSKTVTTTEGETLK